MNTCSAWKRQNMIFRVYEQTVLDTRMLKPHLTFIVAFNRSWLSAPQWKHPTVAEQYYIIQLQYIFLSFSSASTTYWGKYLALWPLNAPLTSRSPTVCCSLSNCQFDSGLATFSKLLWKSTNIQKLFFLQTLDEPFCTQNLNRCRDLFAVLLTSNCLQVKIFCRQEFSVVNTW